MHAGKQGQVSLVVPAQQLHKQASTSFTYKEPQCSHGGVQRPYIQVAYVLCKSEPLLHTLDGVHENKRQASDTGIL